MSLRRRPGQVHAKPVRAPFQVPELTRSADIKLNRQVSLPPHPDALSLTLPDDFPSSGTTLEGQAVKRLFYAWRLVL
jgi:hypothetical protein